MKKTILLLIILFASYSGNAQLTTDNITENFFHSYEKNGLKPALDTLFSYGDKDVQKALSYIKDTLAGTIKVAGNKYCGNEVIIKKTITNSYIYYSFLVKYPLNPMRFNFIFYKPQDKWIMLSFSFNSNITNEAEEFGKLNIYR